MYPKEFLDKAVNEVVTGNSSILTVARKYKISDTTLRHCVHQWEDENGVIVTKRREKPAEIDPELMAKAVAEYSLGNSSITDIAKKYSLNVKTLSRHCPSKEEVCKQHIEAAVNEFKELHTDPQKLVSKYHIPRKILDPYINAEIAKTEKEKKKTEKEIRAKVRAMERAKRKSRKEEVISVLAQIPPLVNATMSRKYSEEQVRKALLEYYSTDKNEYNVAEDNNMAHAGFVFYKKRATEFASDKGLELKKEFLNRRGAPLPTELIYSALDAFFTSTKSIRSVAREYLISHSRFNDYVHATVDSAESMGIRLKRTIDAPGYKKKYPDKDVKAAVLDYLTSDKTLSVIAKENDLPCGVLGYHTDRAKQKILQYGKVTA